MMSRRMAGRAAALTVIGLLLTGCAAGGPPPVTYVLGAPQARERAVEPLMGRPVLAVRTVHMPDYLDGSEILVREQGNVMRASATGRWGERLSVGTTRALAEGLARRMPNVVVTATASERAACEVLVDIEAFERYAAESVVLVAQWRIMDMSAHKILTGERVSLTELAAGPGDAITVAAMSQAVDALAERIAVGVQQVGASCVGLSRTAPERDRS
jgi:uncharacterized lipoprotein YmbA